MLWLLKEPLFIRASVMYTIINFSIEIPQFRPSWPTCWEYLRRVNNNCAGVNNNCPLAKTSLVWLIKFLCYVYQLKFFFLKFLHYIQAFISDKVQNFTIAIHSGVSKCFALKYYHCTMWLQKLINVRGGVWIDIGDCRRIWKKNFFMDI